jgi:murein hydrolase activator
MWKAARRARRTLAAAIAVCPLPGRWAGLRARLRPVALSFLALILATQLPAAGAVREDGSAARSYDGLVGAPVFLRKEGLHRATATPRARKGAGELLRAVPGAEKTVQAAIRGFAVRATALAEEAGARERGLARIEGALKLGTQLDRRASTPAIARLRATSLDRPSPATWSGKGSDGAIAHRAGWRSPERHVSMLDAGRMAAAAARVAPARLYRPEPPVMPLPGEIVRAFGERAGRLRKPGFVIAATPGQAVAAPEEGRIAFAGPFKSYGLLLIIEHSREYHTLLWGFSRIDVAYGEEVRTGQVVGAIGGDAGDTPKLHVELRRNGRPVNPTPWLAASTNRIRG